MQEPTHELEAYFAGIATDEQLRAVEAWLHADPANARSFMDQLRFRELVGQHLREQADQSALALAELARLHEEGLKQPLDIELQRKQRAQTAAANQGSTRRFSTKVIAAGSLAAAIALAGLTVLIVNLFSGPDQPIAEQRDGAIIVATLTDTKDAQWAERALARGSALHAGDTLTLTEGFAEITTHRGAIAILEAPVTIEMLDNSNALRLHEGKLVGICETESSKGFLVRTPHMDIVDVGTKFGVTASEEAVDVSVLVGEVRLERESLPPKRLLAEQSVRLDVEQSSDELVIRPTTAISYTYAVPDSPRTTKAASNLDQFPIDVLASGFQKGAKPYFDRPLSIQPLDSQGLPRALLGGDVIRLHAEARPDKTPGLAPLQVELSLQKRSDVYLIMPPQGNAGSWLNESYELTTMRVGLAMDNVGILHKCSVWKRKQPADGDLVAAGAVDRSMYFLVVVPLE